MFDHPLSLQGVFSSILCINFPNAKTKKANLRAHWKKNRTASLKNSTDLSAPSACFSNYGGIPHRLRLFKPQNQNFKEKKQISLKYKLLVCLIPQQMAIDFVAGPHY